MSRTLAIVLAALSPVPVLAPAEVGSGASAPTGPVAEIVTFRLVPGTDETAFLAAARATEAPVAAQPGFLRRSLSRDETGLWTDYVEWADLPSALNAAQAVMAQPAFASFAAMIAPDDMMMRHAAIAWQMGD